MPNLDRISGDLVFYFDPQLREITFENLNFMNNFRVDLCLLEAINLPAVTGVFGGMNITNTNWRDRDDGNRKNSNQNHKAFCAIVFAVNFFVILSVNKVMCKQQSNKNLTQ